MKLGRVCTIMAFVADPNAAARFWSAAVDAPLHPGPAAVTVGDVVLFFHAADARRAPEVGTVAYFEVDRLDELRAALVRAGCVAHRGPLELADGWRICQLRDPFGTIWALKSRRSERMALSVAQDAPPLADGAGDAVASNGAPPTPMPLLARGG